MEKKRQHRGEALQRPNRLESAVAGRFTTASVIGRFCFVFVAPRNWQISQARLYCLSQPAPLWFMRDPWINDSRWQERAAAAVTHSAASCLSGFKERALSNLADLTGWSVTQSTPVVLPLHQALLLYTCASTPCCCSRPCAGHHFLFHASFCVTSFSQRLFSPDKESLGGLFSLQIWARSWQALSVHISAYQKPGHTHKVTAQHRLGRDWHTSIYVLR